ncbi:MAG: PA2778 family cysteine peptidase [Candidatus Thiodiazotropha sp.]
MRRSLRWDARPWLGVLLSGLISGCSTLGITPKLPPPPADIPPLVELTETPFFPQEQYHCGPAALATLLQHRQIDATPEDLSRLAYLPGRKGSLQIELAATARQQSVLVYPLDGSLNSLLREVAADNPVLILQNQAFSWYPRWHYAVVIGYDLKRELLILRSGRERRWITDFGTFMNTWNRAGNWAIVTLPPGILPAKALPSTYLSAANDLEQTGQQRAAHLAYRAAVETWPSDVTAWLALGNSAYADGQWSEAITAFRKATHLEPANTTAWNNLAYALMEDGQGQAALTALRHALELSPENANLLDSQREIKQRLEME